jgi:uridine kinase
VTPRRVGQQAAIDHVRAVVAARRGRTVWIGVDGFGGAGKTTFAGRLAAALGPAGALVHMDDLYAGWTITGAVARLSAGVLRPLAQGRPGAYHRFDWPAGRFLADADAVPVAEVLVVEGCGSCPPALDRWTTLRVWVEAPPELRLARGVARDGAEMAADWRGWQRMEAAVFAADRTRARADLRVDGAAGDRPDSFRRLP